MLRNDGLSPCVADVCFITTCPCNISSLSIDLSQWTKYGLLLGSVWMASVYDLLLVGETLLPAGDIHPKEHDIVMGCQPKACINSWGTAAASLFQNGLVS